MHFVRLVRLVRLAHKSYKEVDDALVDGGVVCRGAELRGILRPILGNRRAARPSPLRARWIMLLRIGAAAWFTWLGCIEANCAFCANFGLGVVAGGLRWAASL